ncbi:hypothetical protein DFJ74DRAFT_610600 [Hyaloraphidium curvatum]|nr:hypothetical protein DFJ74DRAFT_610600 [Hyaloraphidium curvatum]
MPDASSSEPSSSSEPAEPRWAPLARIDYRLLASGDPADFRAFAEQVDKATTTIGFFVLENPPISAAEIKKHFGLAARFFREVPEDEKLSIPDYMGYKAIGQQEVHPLTKKKDGHERLNIPKFTDATWPEKWEYVKDFSVRSHAIARQLLRVFAFNFGIPESEGGLEYFERRHRYSEPSGDHIRWLRYPPRTAAEEEAAGTQIRMGGHTDHGSITLVYSQPVGGLQVWRTGDDGVARFEYVKPLEHGSIIINLGDAISFWTDGYLKSTLHRVVRPPPPQEMETRYSVVFFTRPEDSQRLSPVPRSIPSGPSGNTLIQREENEEWPTAKDWIRVKIEKGSETGFKDRDAWLKANPWVLAD